MIKAVLFDLGGTLHTATNSAELKRRFGQRLIDRLADYGITVDVSVDRFMERLRENSEIYKHETEASMEEMAPEIVWNDYFLRELNLGRERVKYFAEEFSFLYDYERIRLLRRPHMMEMMDALKAQGLRLGMISNIVSRSFVPHFMMEYGLTEYMDCVITSSMVGIRKPSPEIFRVAERALDLKPEELAYVGDTLSRDVLGARNAGWKMAIQIKNPAIAHRDVKYVGTGLEPDYLIDELDEIPEIIQKYNERSE